jgi:hypothetical protein
MSHNPDSPDFERQQMITKLIGFRTEWETAVDGTSLINVQAPVGFILADLVDLVGFTTAEKQSVLGTPLFDDVNDLIGC